MSVQIDTPRRHWAFADPASTSGRLVYSALSAWRATILARRFEIHPHAEGRMAERRVTLQQLLATVRDGRICSLGSRIGYICGGYLHGELMVIVETAWPRDSDFRDLIPTVSTLYEIDPIELARPLTAPLGELAHLAGRHIARQGSRG
jgi:hypothetical protein